MLSSWHTMNTICFAKSKLSEPSRQVPRTKTLTLRHHYFWPPGAGGFGAPGAGGLGAAGFGAADAANFGGAAGFGAAGFGAAGAAGFGAAGFGAAGFGTAAGPPGP